MGDLFDEFMKELRRRQAEASGRPTRGDKAGDADDQGQDDPDPGAPNDDAPDDDDPDRLAAGEEPPEPIDDHRPRLRTVVPDADDAEDDGPAEPAPPSPRASGGGSGSGDGGGRRRRRRAGGPRDGAPSLRNRLTTAIVVIAIVFVILMLVVGIEIWTDAIWFRSVGYDQVFWTRVWVQVGLFAAGIVITLVVLLGNVWLAGRLVPPADGGGGTFRSWIDRFNEAAANADRARQRGPWDPWGGSARGPRPVGPIEMPDPVPLGSLVILVVAILAALGVAGAIAGSWETILLWQHRVPFDPSGTPVPDPIFGRDISFFLFELPFLRLVQSTVAGLLFAALLLTAGRYLLAAMGGSNAFVTRVRVHLAGLAALLLLAIAFGYQLDKLELTYSTRGIATGVSYTDRNAQFLAYDVLTVITVLAAIVLMVVPFVGRIHVGRERRPLSPLVPIGVVLGVWFVASIAIGRIYPEFVQRITVVPNQQTLEAPYISNNIAMTRLAFDLNTWQEQPYAGDQPLTAAAVESDADTFANARLWDYRPLGDALNQLQTIRQYYAFPDVDIDRYQIGNELSQVMLSGREIALDKNPSATGWVNQRLVYTHGMGAAMVRVSQVTSQGQPDLDISNLPPVSVNGAPQITEPR
ncbi:MAG TPA: UPF0182 family protein, partial [Candidatus Limnocylindrales bacterium]